MVVKYDGSLSWFIGPVVDLDSLLFLIPFLSASHLPRHRPRWNDCLSFCSAKSNVRCLHPKSCPQISSE